MFTEKDLIAGETVLLWKNDTTDKRLYLGNAGLAHFVSASNEYECTGSFYTIKELNGFYTIEQPKSKVVPLEKKVYDFVPVRCRHREAWVNCYLIAVYPNSSYPYKVITDDGDINGFKQCEFLNEQP